jgi:urease accessory protein
MRAEGRENVNQESRTPNAESRTPNLTVLLHLCDSAFPLGSFAYSDGLESAASDGRVATVDDLQAWVDVCLDETIARLDGPAVWHAWAAARDGYLRALEALDEELVAVRPSSAGRRSIRAMGQRLLATWSAIRALDALDLPLTLPSAFAFVCARSDIVRRDAVGAYAYTRLAATTSAAMRLMPLGQTDAHALLARTLDRVPAVVDDIARRNARIESFTPALDIAAMTQQYVHSRLFRS